MTIAGGYGEGANYNDVWVLQNANGLGGKPKWTQLSPTGGLPSATGLRSKAYDRKRPTNPSSQKARQGCIVVSWP